MHPTGFVYSQILFHFVELILSLLSLFLEGMTHVLWQQIRPECVPVRHDVQTSKGKLRLT